MGCASSKQTRCRHCQSPYSPLHRSYSVPVHHPSQSKGDSYHVVALTSSTLGSLKLNSNDYSQSNHNFQTQYHHKPTTTTTTNESNEKDFSLEVIQAKSWSTMINEKIPKVIPRTPIRTPPGEPETINTWELMEGLDDCSPFRLPNRVDRSFSFHAVSNSSPLDSPRSNSPQNGMGSPSIDILESGLQENGFVLLSLDQRESKVQEQDIESPILDQPKSDLHENGNGSDTLDQPPELEILENVVGLPALDHPKSELQENGKVSPSVDHLKPKLQENEDDSVTVDHPKQELQENEDDSVTVDQPKTKIQENGIGSPKPEWLQMVDNDSNCNSDARISEFDPEIISTFRKALEAISPVHPIYLRSPEKEKTTSPNDNFFILKEFVDTKKVSNAIIPSKCPPFGEDKVVIYFTSLRGVRKTYEDCCHVRVILKGFGVRVDERDVSMHYGFREELKEILGVGFSGGLPKVFVEGKYIGGAEEIRQLNEDGELEKVVAGCAVLADGEGGGVCEGCGDIRFVPCENCSGSCKIYCEDEDEWEGEDGGGGFQRCPDCNENGLVRCPVCCS